MSNTESKPTTPEQARESVHAKSAQLAALITKTNANGYQTTEENK